MVMKMHVMARIDPSSRRCRGDLRRAWSRRRCEVITLPRVTLAFMAGPFTRLPVSRLWEVQRVRSRRVDRNVPIKQPLCPPGCRLQELTVLQDS